MAKTSTSARDGAPAELQTLAQRLKTWRATRPRWRRMPAELWRAAAAVARRHGLSRTAAAFKLGYYELRRRLQAGAARDSRRRRHAIKCLTYDGQGFWLCQKRLAPGRFQHWPQAGATGAVRFDPQQWHLLSGGQLDLPRPLAGPRHQVQTGAAGLLDRGAVGVSAG